MNQGYAPFPVRHYSTLENEPESVLLQTSRCDEENQRSYMFLRPLETVCVRSVEGIPALFEKIERCLEQGLYAAGFLSYECGYHFQNVGAERPYLSGLPLTWFGFYKAPYVFNHLTGRFEDVDPPLEHSVKPNYCSEQFDIVNPSFSISEEEYLPKIDAIKEYIRAGDTYQVNFTDKVSFAFSGPPISMFAVLSKRQRVAYGAFINLGDKHILSFSPELFFRMHDGRIVARPMKGTAPRGRNLAEDSKIVSWLQNDPKNRSENVMIVDLLRNDIGRISEMGSVRVENMFAVEKYESLFQMTSTVIGKLRGGVSRYEMFGSLFPCGSVTGAPKIRTMQIIGELERCPRGVYTGSIGFFSPGGDAVFNVAIRTVVLQGDQGEMGVGSGVVYDSDPLGEYRECILKAKFLTEQEEKFQLIESILWNDEYALLSLHLERLEASAAYFGYAFDRTDLFSKLETNKKELKPGTRYKIRILLDSSGRVTIENFAVIERELSVQIMVSTARTSSEDRFLFHKTTKRELYDSEYMEAHRHGCADVIFLNEKNEVTEGAISNVFVQKDGKLYTPPISCGVLPGVYRRHILEGNPKAEERVLRLEDLRIADAIYICNAIRGLRRVFLRKTT